VPTWFKSKHQSILGIDISSTSVRIIELSGSSNHYSVLAYASTIIPESYMEGHRIKETQKVADLILQLLKSNHFSTKAVAIAVPDSVAISKIIQINDGLNEQDIEEIVLSEADNYIPYPIDDINIDFNVLGAAKKNSAMLDVLIVASKSENITNRVEAIKGAGLEAMVVDVESYAVERAAQLLVNDLPANGVNRNIAILDIGALNTHLYVLNNMKIIFTRDEEFGGMQLVEAVMQQYKMERQEAMLAIEKNTLPKDAEETVFVSFSELILLQVRRALQFFFSSSNQVVIDHLFLAGGVAKLAGIDKSIQDQINIPTTIVNPLAHMTIAKSINAETISRDASKLLVVCGLALRLKE